ncbi:CpsD/CapB family tyrosine-protein kinase [Ureibacillus chungkukjangi]|uniref:non-specific protein-tyrosine kinase n=1 Tax=Ureibacillus chungkukjangi TaxID=1202712 RepID=A0A318TH94_9BACL|nr:CpsD/CapB family tyrosine-protein kinase [Ureibacillus chungkukjangi]PYF03267.1 capsular exopolysaccharide synthesis family protein [Ureibacillus chungkukjangi]
MFKKKNKKSNSMARKIVVATNPKSINSEQYRTIRTNINFSMPDQELRTLLVTSASPSEGKSTTASNIAAVFSQEGKKVLLVDADMRKPTTHHTFKIRNTHGLSSILTRQCEVHEAVQPTDIENLYILPSGPIPPNPAELLASKNMEAVKTRLLEDYDLLVFDTPPILSVADAQIVSNKTDGTVLVINTGKSQKESALKAKELLEAAKANVLGVILNNFKIEDSHYYYYYYGSEE